MSHMNDVPLRLGNVELDDLSDEAALVLGVEVEGGLLVGGVTMAGLCLAGQTGE